MYYLWYAEDMFDHTESDNAGVSGSVWADLPDSISSTMSADRLCGYLWNGGVDMGKVIQLIKYTHLSTCLHYLIELRTVVHTLVLVRPTSRAPLVAYRPVCSSHEGVGVAFTFSVPG